MSFTNVPTSQPSIWINENQWELASINYIIAGSFALICVIFVIYTYFRYKYTRKHPAILLLSKTLSDTGFIISLLLLAYQSHLQKSLLMKQSQSTINDIILQLNQLCRNWLVVPIFFFDLSQYYFIGMCYDLYITLTYPLRSLKSTEITIHIYSWIFAFITTILSKLLETYLNGKNSRNYDPTNEICFFDPNYGGNSIELQEWIAVVIPIIIGVITGVLSLIYVVLRMRGSVKHRFSHAKLQYNILFLCLCILYYKYMYINFRRIVTDHIIYVICYSIIGSIWLLLILQESRHKLFSVYIALIIAGTPFVDALAWFLQKFRHKTCSRNSSVPTPAMIALSNLNKMKSADYHANLMTQFNSINTGYIKNDDCMSDSLRLSLIHNMMDGILQSMDHLKHTMKNEISPNMFPPVSSITVKRGSNEEKILNRNESIHSFLLPIDDDKIKIIEYAPTVFSYLRYIYMHILYIIL